jgi:hypothetical protein
MVQAPDYPAPVGFLEFRTFVRPDAGGSKLKSRKGMPHSSLAKTQLDGIGT